VFYVFVLSACGNDDLCWIIQVDTTNQTCTLTNECAPTLNTGVNEIKIFHDKGILKSNNFCEPIFYHNILFVILFEKCVVILFFFVNLKQLFMIIMYLALSGQTYCLKF
jgi:hypothetical protein